MSTRGGVPRAFSTSCSRAAPGGLYLPTLPTVDAATLALGASVVCDLAFEILSLYIDDVPANALTEDIAQHVRQRCDYAAARARRPARGSGPVQRADAAFKDMAMQLLARW